MKDKLANYDLKVRYDENPDAEPAEARHCDYNKPLEVIWLCRKHHSEWHKNNKPIYKGE